MLHCGCSYCSVVFHSAVLQFIVQCGGSQCKVIFIFHPVRPHVCFHTCAMDLKGQQDTKRRQNIKVCKDYLQNIQVSESDFIVYTHTACVMNNISVFHIADVLTAHGLGLHLFNCNHKANKKHKKSLTRSETLFFSRNTKMTRLSLREKHRISSSVKSKFAQIYTSNSTKSRT